MIFEESFYVHTHTDRIILLPQSPKPTAAGFNEATIADVMGNADPQTTRRYTHATNRAKMRGHSDHRLLVKPCANLSLLPSEMTMLAAPAIPAGMRLGLLPFLIST
jgi:hypothetical protein